MQHFGEADYEIEKAIAAHHGMPYIAKNCECWEGYKRVPGTKPCAPGSCEKCDSHSKKSTTKVADEANERLTALWDQAVEFVKTQKPYQEAIDFLAQNNGAGPDELGWTPPSQIENDIFKHPSIEHEILFGALGEFGFRNLTPEIIAEKINKELYKTYNSYNPYVASQGDKPSPHAAQAVLSALESGDEEGAKELLKKTDCPEGCETHPEGKCNHQYMSAGRTRVRYLINDSSFNKEAAQKKAIFGSGIARRLIKMIAGGACPVCEGKGNLKKIKCKACDGTGSADKIINFGKQKWGEITEGNLPEAVDFFRDEMGFSSLEDDDDWGSFEDDKYDDIGEFDSFDDDDELDGLLKEKSLPAPKEKPKLLDRFRKKDTIPEVAPVSDPESWNDLWGDDELDDEFADINLDSEPDEVDQLLAPTPAAQPQQQQNQGIWDKTKQYFQSQPQQQQQQQQNAPYGVCGGCNAPYQNALQECTNYNCLWSDDNW